MNPTFAIALRGLLGLAVLLVTFPAQATYSIVATDQATQQVGGAVTSCVAPQSVATVYGSAPGHGGINAQAASNTAGRDRGVMLLNMDVAPADIIQQITAAAFDPNSRTRQYGVADLSGRAADFTGTGAQDYKEDRQGTIGAFTYSVQGNILTSKAVIDQAEAGFRGAGCDLAERMMLALERGAQNGEGDSRCTVRMPSIPSNSASIQVDVSGAPVRTYLYISLTENTNVSPLIRLRSMFDTWRMTHPCAVGDGGIVDAGPRDASAGDAARSDASDARESGTAGGGGAGGNPGAGGATGGNGGSTASGAGGSGGNPSGSGGMTGTTGGTGTSGSGTTGGSGPSTSGPSTSGTGTGNPATGGDSGCSCRAVQRPFDLHAASALAAIIGLALARRRRRDDVKTSANSRPS